MTKSFISTLQLRRMRWEGNLVRMIEMRNAFNILMETLGGKRPLEGGEGNIKIYFKGTGCEVVIWLHLAHNKVKWWALVNTVMSLRVS